MVRVDGGDGGGREGMSVNFEKLRIVYKWPPLETAIRDDDERVSSAADPEFALQKTSRC